MPNTLYQSDLPNLELKHRGKVRDIYHVDEKHFLIVASDRLSAFDVIMKQPIPGKGAILTRVSNFWFTRTQNIISNHLSDLPIEQVVPDDAMRRQLGERAIVVHKLKPLPLEAIVRGYLIGSGWKEYQDTGELCGIPLADNIRQADQLPKPLFTPSTKAKSGAHDENISFADMTELVGKDIAQQVHDLSLKIYSEAAQYARQRGLIIADTKFEFGLDNNDQLHLIDEVLTPDSSRFWPLDQYKPGISPPSFDKQIIRDYLETTEWNKAPPPPDLPDDIIALTAAKYAEAEHILTTNAFTKVEH